MDQISSLCDEKMRNSFHISLLAGITVTLY